MKRLRKFWICGVMKRHQWDCSEAEARRSIFLRADCELCGETIDATKLVRMLDALRDRDSQTRVRSIVEGMAEGFRPEEGVR